MIEPIGLYLLSLVVIPLWCAGLRTVTDYKEIPGASVPIQEKKLLWRLRWLGNKMGAWGKPIITCVSCLPSIHGTIIYWTLYKSLCFNPVHIENYFIFWPLAVVSSSFLSAYLWKKLDNLL